MSGQAVARHLERFEFGPLFLDQLGWNHLGVGATVWVGEQAFELSPVAEKRGVQVLHCQPQPDGTLPPYALRQKIERAVTREAREHLLIFSDAARTTQVWQWADRLPGKPIRYREITWHQGQSGELLRQKLRAISFDIAEEKSLTVVGVAQRLRGGFDRDKVTKNFYKRFAEQRGAFEKFIEGIPKAAEEDRRWYTAVLINRLMFIWFLQEKGFLNGSKRYMQDRLAAHEASGSATSFYRAFLCPLFFTGFAVQRTPDNRAQIEAQFGSVPYLNGGLFATHPLEETYGAALDVGNAAFSSLFSFFDQWDWHLDDRPLASGREINPDVLGYIFEKFVNQKQMGAYYTKEDITEYIGKNTIIPALLNKVRAKHPAEFDALVWPLLQAEPDRYIYPAMKRGVDTPYPPDIETGRDANAPGLLVRRKPWNGKTPEPWALPTEIWRETIARHDRTREVHAKLVAGEVRDVADLITYNLDIRQFAQDLIERCTHVPLLREFWAALAGRVPRKHGEKFRHGLSVLDPTCGSGAFLFAALGILKPLYDAALGTMASLLADAAISGQKSHPEKWADIEGTVRRFHTHADGDATERQRDYAVIKHIVVNNLYGVDIEEQATEIAKLRLFLKLVALLEVGDDIEPLPDIDFNIRAGNTLVGYATAEETERAVTGAVQTNLFSDAWEDIRIRLTAVEESYNNFQIQQVQRGGHVTAEDKEDLSRQLGELDEMLNWHLCREYGKDPGKGKQLQDWKASHRPFHWYVDFYPMMIGGGFDVVIGNPPYVVFPSKDVPYGWNPGQYTCESTKNLYALVAERSRVLASLNGATGLIIQLTSMSSDRMAPLQESMTRNVRLFILPFPRRPEALFEGVEMPTAIWIALASHGERIATTTVRRFYGEQRENAFTTFRLCSDATREFGFRLAKVDTTVALDVLKKLRGRKSVGTLVSKSGGSKVFYQEACRYWLKASTFSPRFVRNGEPMEQPHGRTLMLLDDRASAFVNCVLNSSLFYWYYSTLADCEHVNDSLVRGFPLPTDWDELNWLQISRAINARLQSSSVAKRIVTKQGHVIEYDEINGKAAREETVIADVALGKVFDLTPEELDYVVNYDIKYRMGQEAAVDD